MTSFCGDLVLSCFFSYLKRFISDPLRFTARKIERMAASLAARSFQRLCLSAVRPQIKSRYLSSSSSLLAAQVQKPAPAFKAQAVVDGQFKEVSLEDYKVRSL